MGISTIAGICVASAVVTVLSNVATNGVTWIYASPFGPLVLLMFAILASISANRQAADTPASTEEDWGDED